MSDLLQHFDKNELGRNFVVGDLVDRSPESMACLSLLKESWFHAVLGNHEDLLLDAVSSNLRNGVLTWVNNGGDWGVEQFEDGNPEFFDLIDLVNELPFAIIIKTKELGLICVCHAEPPSKWSEGCIEDEANHLLWSRRKIDAPSNTMNKTNVDFSVHGYTVTDAINVRDEINAFGIDLGCYSTGRLCALQVSGPKVVWPAENIFYKKRN